jgi:hypothetical protein
MKQIRESYEGHAALHGTEQVPVLSFPNIRPHVQTEHTIGVLVDNAIRIIPNSFTFAEAAASPVIGPKLHKSHKSHQPLNWSYNYKVEVATKAAESFRNANIVLLVGQGCECSLSPCDVGVSCGTPSHGNMPIMRRVAASSPQSYKRAVLGEEP